MFKTKYNKNQCSTFTKKFRDRKISTHKDIDNIADIFKVSRRTIYYWVERNKQFSQFFLARYIGGYNLSYKAIEDKVVSRVRYSGGIPKCIRCTILLREHQKGTHEDYCKSCETRYL